MVNKTLVINIRSGAALALLLAQPAASCLAGEVPIVESEVENFRVEQVADGLQVPWAIVFLPDGDALVSERNTGRIVRLSLETGTISELAGGPGDVYVNRNGGMLDVALHPDFASNRFVYYCYSAGDAMLNTTVVERARLENDEFTNRERIFEALPWYHNAIVYGCRLAFRDDYLFVTMGDRWDLRHLSQSPGSHIGKVLRLHHDGSPPADNPYVDVPGAMPEVFSIGNRNPQGLVVHPETSDLWEHEHGPKGGDEINVIEAGSNYGWPVITYGKEYTDEPVGEGLTEMEGMEQPVHYYVPSIAPSDMFFYTGEVFAGWRGNLFLGALAGAHLNRLVVEGHEVVHEERLLGDRDWRVRTARQGPDGLIYLGVDTGGIYRLVPADGAP
jgi:glucose/arabinose dehydrogenase